MSNKNNNNVEDKWIKVEETPNVEEVKNETNVNVEPEEVVNEVEEVLHEELINEELINETNLNVDYTNDNKIKIVDAEFVNFRSSAAMEDDNVIEILDASKSYHIEILDRSNTFFKVKVDNVEGYIYHLYVK